QLEKSVEKSKKANDDLQSQIARIPKLEELVEKSKKANDALQGQIARIPKKPFAIPLKETSGFNFESGKADLSPEFKNNFRKDILPKISKYFEQYEVNLIEVIGHTDGQRLSQ